MAMALGFDSSILSAFARAERLDVLERIVSGHRCVVTRAVLDEIERGCSQYPALSDVAVLPWVATVSVDSLDELVAFAYYVRVLGAGDHDIGEASILAWAETRSGIAVVDDNAAVTAARARGVMVRRSLGLLCHGLNRGILTMDGARALVDDLRGAGGARLPCDGAGFERWAESNGLLLRDDPALKP
jgi:predicted nucleic acid-binding protein